MVLSGGARCATPLLRASSLLKRILNISFSSRPSDLTPIAKNGQWTLQRTDYDTIPEAFLNVVG
jgi:hypothetical protein